MANLVNDQAGGPDQAGQAGCLLAGTPGQGELIPEFGCLYEVGLQAVLTALIAKRLGQMGLLPQYCELESWR